MVVQSLRDTFCGNDARIPQILVDVLDQPLKLLCVFRPNNSALAGQRSRWSNLGSGLWQHALLRDDDLSSSAILVGVKRLALDLSV